MRKKIPYGIGYFKKIRTESYVYIDKTRYLAQLENLGEASVFFLRPRRFGKSLWISTLEQYYGIQHAQDFEAVFKGLYIHDNPTPLRNSYAVLRFDFSGIDTQQDSLTLLHSFSTNVCESLRHFAMTYGVPFDDSETQPAALLRHFLTSLSVHFPHKIYILIDEYDHFTNELLSFQPNRFQDVVTGAGFVRKFYEVIKEWIGRGLVDRFFATGVTPVTLDSLTSGFNIAANLSLIPNLHNMMGFTHDELATAIVDVLPDSPSETLLPTLQTYYNGYRFSRTVTETLFNSDMALYYLKHLLQTGSPPEHMVDPNIASDYGKVAKVFDLCPGQVEEKQALIEQLIAGESVATQLTVQYSLEKGFSLDDLQSLLFYMGYLTVTGYDVGTLFLGIPNHVIKELYFDYFQHLFQTQIGAAVETSKISEAVRTLAKTGDITPLVSIVERTLHHLSNRDFIRFDEKYIKLIFLTYLMMTKIYYVQSEVETPHGYIDILLSRRINVAAPYEVIIELKYLKEAEKQEEASRLDSAISQLQKYTATDIMKDKNTSLAKWALVFVGERCVAAAQAPRA